MWCIYAIWELNQINLIFTHFKLSLTTATHNFKITYVCLMFPLFNHQYQLFDLLIKQIKNEYWHLKG